MTKLEELRGLLKQFTNDKLDTTQIKQMGEIGAKIDEIEQEQTKQKEDYSSLQGEYIKVVQNYGFGSKDKNADNPNPNQNNEKSIEEIGFEIIANRNKKEN